MSSRECVSRARRLSSPRSARTAPRRWSTDRRTATSPRGSTLWPGRGSSGARRAGGHRRAGGCAGWEVIAALEVALGGRIMHRWRVYRNGGEALLAQPERPLLVGRRQRRERSDRPAQQEIRQAGVAYERGPVQVRAEDPARVGALRPIPVAHARQHARQRRGIGTQLRDPLVILESGEPGHAKSGVDVGEDLTNPAALPTPASDVENVQAGQELAVVTAELGPDQLVTGTDGEDHRAPAGRRGRGAVPPNPAGGEDLRQILPSAQQV